MADETEGQRKTPETDSERAGLDFERVAAFANRFTGSTRVTLLVIGFLAVLLPVIVRTIMMVTTGGDKDGEN